MPVYAAKKCAANAAHTVGLHNDANQLRGFFASAELALLYGLNYGLTF